MKVSVVIPVFNAEEFLERAVLSAIEQRGEVRVILIEDGGSESEWKLCQELEDRHPEVKLFCHAGRQNRGAAASRNLGIQVAESDWICFLDADDFMLSGRFDRVEEVLEGFPDTEAVYEAVGFHFESEEVEEAFWDRPGVQRQKLTTVEKCIAPEAAFREMSPIGTAGYACTDGWTVRKDLLERCGGFNEKLELHEDTDLFMRLTIGGVCRPGCLSDAVAMRGVHGGNRITKPRGKEALWRDLSRMYESTWEWALINGFESEAMILESASRRCFWNAPVDEIVAFLSVWVHESPEGGIHRAMMEEEVPSPSKIRELCGPRSLVRRVGRRLKRMTMQLVAFCFRQKAASA